MLKSSAIILLLLSLVNPFSDASEKETAANRKPRELLKASMPFVETYWESDDSWPYDYYNCMYQDPNK